MYLSCICVAMASYDAEFPQKHEIFCPEKLFLANTFSTWELRSLKRWTPLEKSLYYYDVWPCYCDCLCSVLNCTAVYCTLLYFTELHYTTVDSTAVYTAPRNYEKPFFIFNFHLITCITMTPSYNFIIVSNTLLLFFFLFIIILHPSLLHHHLYHHFLNRQHILTIITISFLSRWFGRNFYVSSYQGLQGRNVASISGAHNRIHFIRKSFRFRIFLYFIRLCVSF